MLEPLSVLFLCTGNSARSIISEAILTSLSKGRFAAYSAGSNPAGRVNPYALELLERKGHATSFARSKSWSEFESASAPKLDFVFTACGSAAGEQCPVWHGAPMTAHWGISGPAAVTGSEAHIRHAFDRAYTLLERKIRKFVALPIANLKPSDLQTELDAIGRMDLEVAETT
ncbi:MAG: arsenate reductase ArsC [Pseudomonadota bacterium]